VADGRLERWTSWIGGPYGLLVVLGLQVALALIFAFSPMATVAIIGALGAVAVVVEYPVLGVGALIAARLLSTGAVVFFRIGHMGIGPFEPALMLSAGALVVHAVTNRLPLALRWTWRTPFVLFCGFAAVSVLWCVDKGDAIGDLIPLALILANAIVILTFIRTWRQFLWMMRAWFATTVFIGILTLMLDALGIQVGSVTFKAASGGGRETGLGQQPNWFAMNQYFGLLPSFGIALLEKRPLRRAALMLGSLFILFMMLKSGSRGGAYALVVAMTALGLGNAGFRKWFLRASLVLGAVFAVGIGFDVGGSAKALMRIGSSVAIEENYRPLNWEACVQMFLDTYGRGIGAGGYEELLPQYNNYLAESLYDYPHGIFWEVIAHYGVVGLALVIWLVVVAIGMTRRLIVAARGTEAEVFAWTMPATILGYAAWSFVEFTFAEKPLWEFLALMTALHSVVLSERTFAEVPSWEGLGGRRRSSG